MSESQFGGSWEKVREIAEKAAAEIAYELLLKHDEAEPKEHWTAHHIHQMAEKEADRCYRERMDFHLETYHPGQYPEVETVPVPRAAWKELGKAFSDCDACGGGNQAPCDDDWLTLLRVWRACGLSRFEEK